MKKLSKTKFIKISRPHNKSLIFDKVLPRQITLPSLNENLEKQCTEVRKTEVFPLIKINSRNSTRYDLEKEKTPIDIDKTRKFLNLNFISNNDIPREEKIQIKNLKNAETQTEEIFFTKSWTYFQALNYVVLENNSYNYYKRFHKVENISRLKFVKSPELRIKSYDLFKFSRDATKAIQPENKTHLSIHSNKIEFNVKTKVNLTPLGSNQIQNYNFTSKR